MPVATYAQSTATVRSGVANATPVDAGNMLPTTFRVNGTEHRLNLD